MDNDKPEQKAVDLDAFVEQTNREIRKQLEQTYSPAVVERFYDPKNLGPLNDFNGHAQIKGPCGDTMEIWLKIESDVVRQAHFITDGCCSSIACASMATELALGKTPEDAMEVSQDNIILSLGGLPEESAHCALLASNTLRAAIKDYFTRQTAT